MQNISIKDLLLIDIETVPQFETHEKLPTHWAKLWHDKVHKILPQNTTTEELYDLRAGVMAEFSKIICISIGYYNYEGELLTLRIKSFFEDDEKTLLNSFIKALFLVDETNKKWCFAGHNIKEFDIPFICRRLVVHGIKIPEFLNFQNKKPWETNLIDTFQYWRFGDYKYFTSLNLLAAALGIDSPKDDIDGSMVSKVYWKEQDINRIVAYCQKDVFTTGNIILHFKNMPVLQIEQMIIIK